MGDCDDDEAENDFIPELGTDVRVYNIRLTSDQASYSCYISLSEELGEIIEDYDEFKFKILPQSNGSG